MRTLEPVETIIIMLAVIGLTMLSLVVIIGLYWGLT